MKMGFINKNETKTQAPIVDITFTNAICYGQTGSGKTTGFMLPNIENRIKQNHGILIYDFKGNVHEHIKNLAIKYDKLGSVFEVGKPWGKNIDILNYATTKTLESMFMAISGRNDIDDYWTNSAYTLFNNIYFLLKHLKTTASIIKQIDINIANYDIDKLNTIYSPTIGNISNITKSATSLSKFFEDIKTTINYLDTISKEYLIANHYDKKTEQLLSKYFKVLDDAIQRYNHLEEYHNISNNESNPNGGNNGVLQVLSNAINSIAHKQCFNQDQFDIVDNLINGKIVIIDVSGFNTQMLNFLNLSIYNRLIRQTSISYDKSPITIFIDEAQKIINENSLPDTDVCRENRFEFIFATQDRLLLEKQIGSMNMESLNRNITSQFSFKTTAPQKTKVDTTTLDKFEYTNIISGEKFLSDPIFFNDDELFEVEYLYQKFIGASYYVDLNPKQKYILT